MSEVPGNGSDSSELTPGQKDILEGFVGHFTDESNRTIQHVGYYDLVSANIRGAFQKFELPMENPADYYPVMAGLSVATEWIKGLVQQGRTVEEAIEIIRDGFARLAPPGCLPTSD